MKPGTIVALASGAGRAGVAVIRVSGPDAGLVCCNEGCGICTKPTEACIALLRR